MNLTDVEMCEMLAAFKANANAQAEIREWLKTRPSVIQELVRRYPMDMAYRVKDGAPYGGSAPGCIVGVASYFEDGTVSVVVLRPSTIMSEMLSDLTRLQMDPKWLEEYEPCH